MSEQASKDRETFLTPEWFAREQKERMESARGRLLIAGLRSGAELAGRVVERYGELLREAGSADEVLHLGEIDRRFANDETCVRLDRHVGGYDVYLIQALVNPRSALSVDDNYAAFLIAARTFCEHGARHVTGILPYLAYGRQDKPTKFQREPTTAKLMADLAVAAGIDRLVSWEPHCGQIRGFYAPLCVHLLESLTLFVEQFEHWRGREDVIVVAPDVGASKFVTHFGRALELECAIASKYRPRPDEAAITQVIGEFAGKRVALLLDDEISTGGTVYALARKLVKDYQIEEVHVGVSHNHCLPIARERLAELHEQGALRSVLVTNSIPQTDEFLELPFFEARCLSDALARTINRIHYNRSVSEVFWRPGAEGG